MARVGMHRRLLRRGILRRRDDRSQNEPLAFNRSLRTLVRREARHEAQREFRNMMNVSDGNGKGVDATAPPLDISAMAQAALSMATPAESRAEAPIEVPIEAPAEAPAEALVAASTVSSVPTVVETSTSSNVVQHDTTTPNSENDNPKTHLDEKGLVINHRNAYGRITKDGQFRCLVGTCTSLIQNEHKDIQSHVGKMHGGDSQYKREQVIGMRRCSVCDKEVLSFSRMKGHIRSRHNIIGKTGAIKAQYANSSIGDTIDVEAKPK
ncbi:hypothetical protein F4805DRAFT_478275 [Annulohypoxylon moriforme]|nr:hypothetical protein F4805DRAFT_478275 [Annulohypoxylon moriforme]